ncbi:hypothetical protein [Xanthomonas albilineans]|nr:hypothetical protein [Xanthomonas albilineans]QHQ28407.1 hypothetical protein XaFJ1_GM001665 [Xanthomonas albilineans]
MNASTERHLLHERRQRPDGPVPVDVFFIQSPLLRFAAGRAQ